MTTMTLDPPATDSLTLEQKVDYLIEIVEAQRQRQMVLEELQADLVPIFNQLFKLTVNELDEIGSDFQLEDLLYLVKRLLRNTSLFINLLDQLESTTALLQEVGLLIKPMFNQTVEGLDEMERKGLFNFMQGAWYILEQILTEFDEEDVRALGDNVVTILKTVRSMTQPEMMTLVDKLVTTISDEAPADQDVSTWKLLREFSDPQVRRGLARLLGAVKSLAEQPANGNDNQ